MVDAEGSWFNTGYEHIPEPAPQRSEADNRFWLKKGESTLVTMITDDPFGFYEHQVEVGGRWDVYLTCTQGFRQCALCDAGVKRYYVGMFSIIHEGTFKFKTRDGKDKEQVNPKKLLPAKAEMLKKFKNWKEKRGTLISARFDVTRLNDEKAERIGNDWQIREGVAESSEDGTRRTIEEMKQIAQTRLARMFGQDEKGVLKASPHDYRELFKPKSEEEIKKIVSQLAAAKTVKDSGVGGSADIPF